ncbi:hypothetical protein HETIRDRAFT_332496 [Heterobasidion irregulare TC 32-1]|uniref:HpcH/HpaI aldolase/citrate lyase domain-containing protein n=1 Tax=Heterobasidion irregulare (strain TC 32-1) TaxID=747525 RepID=W4JN43_HETIT|nr:uncharacterized protein HETIRDRAFT_332496 [Heterobasidion irregulare TC 32-1]ETW74982.1 hypothetical protein HETIRDRAFT_332496 [Heterobasidion irregulare TC 32-1]
MQHLRASSLFQPSNLSKAIRDTLDPSSRGPTHLFGSIMAFPHHVVARSVAVLGFDFVLIDALHTAIGPENLIRLVQTVNLASEGRTCAIVRVPNEHSYLLTHALDAGAAGIVFPHIDTPQQARIAVSKTKYAYSGGERSLSPSALIAGASDMAPEGSSHERVADEHVAVICQIESKLGLENAEAIALTPGVSSLMLGPGDMRVSLGLPSKRTGAFDSPEYLKVVQRLIAVSERHHVPLMTVTFKTSAKTDSWISKFRLLLTSADVISVSNGHRQDLSSTKQILRDYGYDERN